MVDFNKYYSKRLIKERFLNSSGVILYSPGMDELFIGYAYSLTSYYDKKTKAVKTVTTYHIEDEYGKIREKDFIGVMPDDSILKFIGFL
jgi:hypothetical protein